MGKIITILEKGTGVPITLTINGREDIVSCQLLKDGSYFVRAEIYGKPRAFIFTSEGRENGWVDAEPYSKEEIGLLIHHFFVTTPYEDN